MNPGILDHLLAAALVIGFALWAFLGYRKFLRRIAAGDPDARRREYRETVLVQWAVTLLVLVVWFATGRTGAELGPGPASAARYLAAGALGLVIIGFLVLQWWTLVRDEARLVRVRDSVAGLAPLLPRTDVEARWFAAVSLTAGICEEILYRGFLFAWAMAWAGPWGALVVTSLAFGIGHAYQGATGVGKTAFVGLVLGGLVLLGGSLWPAMLIHVVLDLTSGSLGRRALALPPEAEPAGA